MPNIVTFDPIRLLIIEIPVYATESPTPSPQTMLDNETSMQEIYSEYKEYFAGTAGSPTSAGLGLPPAIRVIGGDPVTATQDAGITYFMINGWRFKPAEGDHKWTIVGNVFSDPAGQSVFKFTDGPYNVNTETRVSNLVDSSVARLDLIQLIDAIHIDTETTRGVAGTGTIDGTQIGTPTLPVNNIADARTIANTFNVRTYHTTGDIILDQAHNDWLFVGNSIETSKVNLNGMSVAASVFTRAAVEGAALLQDPSPRSSIRPITLRECQIPPGGGIQNFAGTMIDCAIGADVACGPGRISLLSCSSEVAGTDTPQISKSGYFGDVNVRAWSGGIEIRDFANGDNCSIDLLSGHVIVDSTCTDGVIVIRGTGHWTDNRGSPEPALLTVVTTGLVQGPHTSLLPQIASETDIMAALIAGDAEVSTNDLTVTLYENESPTPSPRTIKAVYSISADGRIRNRIV